MANGSEYLDVERPLIEQLQELGWTYIEASLEYRSAKPMTATTYATATQQPPISN